MKKNITVICGLLMLGIGLYVIKAGVELQGFVRAIPYALVGLGCGAFGKGMGESIRVKAVKNHPDIQKQIKIDQEDERNIVIGNRAKAKAYDMMIFIFGAIMFSFALMKIDLAAILLLVCAYLFVVGYGIYYRCKFDKEM